MGDNPFQSDVVNATTEKIGGFNYGRKVVPGNGMQKGSSNEAILKESFPGSPVFAGTIPLYSEYHDKVLRGTSDINSEGINFDFTVVGDDGGSASVVSRTFAENGPPDYGDVETGGGGLPSSPWTPNTSSPIAAGMPSTNYADIPPVPAEDAITETDANNNPGIGLGGLLSPEDSSITTQQD